MAIEFTAEIEEFLGFLTEPAIAVPDYKDTEPERPTMATIRQIDFDPTGNGLEISYTKSNHDVDIGDAGGLTSLLKIVADPQYNSYPDNPKAPKDNPNKKYDTPLSLYNDRWCYVIFVLTGRSWQFAGKRPPIAISPEAYQAKAYFEARRVDRNGNADSGKVGVKNHCKVAYFIADRRKMTGSYTHHFNIHVDLITEDWEGEEAYVPITIDPDIRYPGGSGEP